MPCQKLAVPNSTAFGVERKTPRGAFLWPSATVAALGLTDRAREMLEADPSLIALRTRQGEYDEKPPSSYHIYQWTVGPNLTPLQVAAKFGRHETLRVMKQFASPRAR